MESLPQLVETTLAVLKKVDEWIQKDDSDKRLADALTKTNVPVYDVPLIRVGVKLLPVRDAVMIRPAPKLHALCATAFRLAICNENFYPQTMGKHPCTEFIETFRPTVMCQWNSFPVVTDEAAIAQFRLKLRLEDKIEPILDPARALYLREPKEYKTVAVNAVGETSRVYGVGFKIPVEFCLPGSNPWPNTVKRVVSEEAKKAKEAEEAEKAKKAKTNKVKDPKKDVSPKELMKRLEETIDSLEAAPLEYKDFTEAYGFEEKYFGSLDDAMRKYGWQRVRLGVKDVDRAQWEQDRPICMIGALNSATYPLPIIAFLYKTASREFSAVVDRAFSHFRTTTVPDVVIVGVDDPATDIGSVTSLVSTLGREYVSLGLYNASIVLFNPQTISVVLDPRVEHTPSGLDIQWMDLRYHVPPPPR